ncbi:hypothetical protein V5799_018471 [Amblyomma americanum]|uniref:Uncharacterized protein n=1 Tax=Amblyomma americanum TaxID=6943 RepID=A0AAQ4EZ62_AMBAM
MNDRASLSQLVARAERTGTRRPGLPLKADRQVALRTLQPPDTVGHRLSNSQEVTCTAAGFGTCGADGTRRDSGSQGEMPVAVEGANDR